VQKWRVGIRVDGSVYVILGDSTLQVVDHNNSTTLHGFPSANITNTMVMSTQTILTAEAGPMQVNLTFMNPVEVVFDYLVHAIWPLLTPFLSVQIGSNNQYLSHTFLSPQDR
jgi:hypothetical protein